jgi:hypothetical protein
MTNTTAVLLLSSNCGRMHALTRTCTKRVCSSHLVWALIFLAVYSVIRVLDQKDQCFLQGGHGEPSSTRPSAHRNVWGWVAFTTRQFTQPSRHFGLASSQTTAPEKNLQLSQHFGNSAACTHAIKISFSNQQQGTFLLTGFTWVNYRMCYLYF